MQSKWITTLPKLAYNFANRFYNFRSKNFIKNTEPHLDFTAGSNGLILVIYNLYLTYFCRKNCQYLRQVLDCRIKRFLVNFFEIEKPKI